jgi:hypothetical protein
MYDPMIVANRQIFLEIAYILPINALSCLVLATRKPRARANNRLRVA